MDGAKYTGVKGGVAPFNSNRIYPIEFLSEAIGIPQERKAPQSNGVSLRPCKQGSEGTYHHKDTKI